MNKRDPTAKERMKRMRKKRKQAGKKRRELSATDEEWVLIKEEAERICARS